jgi:hypothetical protein
MIVYDPTTKQETKMEIKEYLMYLKSQGDSIQINPIRRDGYTPLIVIYKNHKKVSYHCMGISEAECTEINKALPAMRKTDNSFNLNKVKI